MDPGNLRLALRQRTRQLHARLDDSLTGPSGRVADRAGYLRVIDTLHTLHAFADPLLARWARSSALASPLTVSGLPDRAPSYAADLADLGEPVTGAPPAGDGREVVESRGLALLYLLSGSAAGARVLLAGLPASIPESARRGLSDAAAPASTRLWRETCGLLSDGTVPARLHDEVVAETRDVLEWLVGRTQPVTS